MLILTVFGLSTAYMSGRSGIVKLLIDAGCDVTFADSVTTFPYAYMDGHEDTVQVLLNWGAEVSCIDKKGYTSLRYACDGGHEAIAKLLLNAHADVNSQTLSSKTPSTKAARQAIKMSSSFSSPQALTQNARITPEFPCTKPVDRRNQWYFTFSYKQVRI